MVDANLLLYSNIAGETFYIIVHRMKSQKIREDLQRRVYNDLAAKIFQPTVIHSIITGSLNLLDKKFCEVKGIVDKIVHSSIMSVNSFSLEKLFELTLIATKYQYTVCQYPTDILLIALNHVDGIRNSITDPGTIQMSENFHSILKSLYGTLMAWDMQLLRYSILNFVCDVRLKMTNLIRLGFQKDTGEFVKRIPDKHRHAELQVPGIIELYTDPRDGLGDPDSHWFQNYIEACEKGEQIQLNELREVIIISDEMTLSSFDIYRHYFTEEYFGMCPPLPSSLNLKEGRGSSVGESIYEIPGNSAEEDEPRPGDTKTDGQLESRRPSQSSCQDVSKDNNATRGLDLCSVLLGCDSAQVGSDSRAYSSLAQCGYPRGGSNVKSKSVNTPSTSESSVINVVQIDASNPSNTANRFALMDMFRDFDLAEQSNSNVERSHQNEVQWDCIIQDN